MTRYIVIDKLQVPEKEGIGEEDLVQRWDGGDPPQPL